VKRLKHSGMRETTNDKETDLHEQIARSGGGRPPRPGWWDAGSRARRSRGRQTDLQCGWRLGVRVRLVEGGALHLSAGRVPAGGRPEHYAGSINKFGVDIGYTEGGVLVWGVFAPSSNLGPGALSGNYVGATGSATVGVGAGANVLVGGSNRTISLQPVSFEGNTGLNVAAGIGAINLRYQPQAARQR